MSLRLNALFALIIILPLIGQVKPVPDCCDSSAANVSPRKVKLMVQKTKPILPPCCAEMLHLVGTVVLAIAVDTDGNVTCLRVVSANPLIAASALNSISKWKFKPYVSDGRKKNFCGRIAVQYEANEREVHYDVVEAP